MNERMKENLFHWREPNLDESGSFSSGSGKERLHVDLKETALKIFRSHNVSRALSLSPSLVRGTSSHNAGL